MIISTNPKFIFLHIPKTAGTSVEESLYDYHDFDFNDDPHLELLYYYDDMTKEEFESFYKFTVIRNPFTLLYSTWVYYVKQNEIDIEFNDWIKWRYTENYGKYKHMVKDNDPGNFRLSYYINRYPQTMWLVNRKGDFIIDHTLCFERLENDLSIIFDKLKLGDMYLPHANKSAYFNTKRYIEYYNEESIEIVKREFKIDFELFGYSDTQEEPIGGLWGENIKGKSLNEFGFNLPQGVILNVGQLPYGPHDIIYRYFGDKDRESSLEEFTTNRLFQRRTSLQSDISSLDEGIQKLEQELEHNEDITDEEVYNIISNITRMTERQLVYRQKVIEINRKLKER